MGWLRTAFLALGHLTELLVDVEGRVGVGG